MSKSQGGLVGAVVTAALGGAALVVGGVISMLRKGGGPETGEKPILFIDAHHTDENNQEGDQCETLGDQEGNGGGTGGEWQGVDAGGQRIYSNEEHISCDFSSDTTCQPSNSTDEDGEKTRQKMVSGPWAPWCNMGLLNVRSVNNKQLRISDFINKFDLEGLILDETWLTEENGDQRLGEILPEEFKFYHQPRVYKEGKPKRGGGVAVGHSNNLKAIRVELGMSFESFEYMVVDLYHDEWDRPIRIIAVYRPPRRNDKDMTEFQEEFQNLLDKFSEDDSILIAGDFNIKVNDEDNKHAKWFKEVLEVNNLNQYVEEETHKNHNILDLVITRNVDISELKVKKPKPKTETKTNKKTNEVTEKNTTISDHSLIKFSVRPVSQNKEESNLTDNKRFKDREE